MSKLDARTKLLLVIIVTTLAILATDLVYLAIVVAVTLLIDILVRADMNKIFMRIWRLFTVIVFISLVQSLTIKGGKPLIYIGSTILLSTKGLIYAGEFLLRMSVIILAGTIMSTCKEQEILDGLLKMHLPYELVFMTSISLRFLPTFRQEFSSRLNAIEIRGISIKRLALIKKIKLYSYLIAPTISGSMIRSKQIAMSMQSKAFRAYRSRTMLADPILTVFDYFVIIVSMLAMALYLYFMYTLGEII